MIILVVNDLWSLLNYIIAYLLEIADETSIYGISVWQICMIFLGIFDITLIVRAIFRARGGDKK